MGSALPQLVERVRGFAGCDQEALFREAGRLEQIGAGQLLVGATASLSGGRRRKQRRSALNARPKENGPENAFAVWLQKLL